MSFTVIVEILSQRLVISRSRWMNLPDGFIFENENSAFLKLIAQPMFLVGSGVEGHDRASEFCDASEWPDVQKSLVKFLRE